MSQINVQATPRKDGTGSDVEMKKMTKKEAEFIHRVLVNTLIHNPQWAQVLENPVLKKGFMGIGAGVEFKFKGNAQQLYQLVGGLQKAASGTPSWMG